uniref:Uncharacterized protein n=1 Tax=Hyaloperonospora arabidopsidis (strain Emoy2) TaxID=559515 RepID=M4C5M1_HYAAE
MNPPGGAGTCDRSGSGAVGSGLLQDCREVLICTATRTWVKKANDDLRPMIPLEKEALAAWMMGGIMLQSPPGFSVCTPPRTTRVAMLDFFEAYLEGQVIATLPPYVRMPQYIAEKTLLIQLLKGSAGQTESDAMSRELVKGAKMTSYNADTRQ